MKAAGLNGTNSVGEAVFLLGFPCCDSELCFCTLSVALAGIVNFALAVTWGWAVCLLLGWLVEGCRLSADNFAWTGLYFRFPKSNNAAKQLVEAWASCLGPRVTGLTLFLAGVVESSAAAS